MWRWCLKRYDVLHKSSGKRKPVISKRLPTGSCLANLIHNFLTRAITFNPIITSGNVPHPSTSTHAQVSWRLPSWSRSAFTDFNHATKKLCVVSFVQVRSSRVLQFITNKKAKVQTDNVLLKEGMSKSVFILYSNCTSFHPEGCFSSILEWGDLFNWFTHSINGLGWGGALRTVSWRFSSFPVLLEWSPIFRAILHERKKK